MKLQTHVTAREIELKLEMAFQDGRHQGARDVFKLAHKYALEDKTMIGSENLRDYHYFNAINKIGQLDGR